MRRFILISLVILLEGCIVLPISNDKEISLSIEGTVSDATTGEPIVGAIVTLSLPDDYYPDIKPTLSTETDAHGGFKVGPIIEKSDSYVIWFLPVEGSCIGVVSVSAEGYTSSKQEYREFGGAVANGACSSYPSERHIRLQRNEI